MSMRMTPNKVEKSASHKSINQQKLNIFFYMNFNGNPFYLMLKSSQLLRQINKSERHIMWNDFAEEKIGEHTLTANSPIAQQALFATETVSFSLEVFCINHSLHKIYKKKKTNT